MAEELQRLQFNPAEFGIEDGVAKPDPDVVSAFVDAIKIDELGGSGAVASAEDGVELISTATVCLGEGQTIMPERLHVESGSEGETLFLRMAGAMVERVRDDVRKSIETIMRNVKLMNKVLGIAQQQSAVALEAILQAEIAHIDALRAKVETPELKDKLLTNLRKIVTDVFGIPDLDVELLPTQDALAYGCTGLYMPARGKARAKVYVPISKYGTEEVLLNDRLLDNFVHVVAFHCISHTTVSELAPDHRLYTQDSYYADKRAAGEKLYATKYFIPASVLNYNEAQCFASFAEAVNFSRSRIGWSIHNWLHDHVKDEIKTLIPQSSESLRKCAW